MKRRDFLRFAGGVSLVGGSSSVAAESGDDMYDIKVLDTVFEFTEKWRNIQAQRIVFDGRKGPICVSLDAERMFHAAIMRGVMEVNKISNDIWLKTQSCSGAQHLSIHVVDHFPGFPPEIIDKYRKAIDHVLKNNLLDPEASSILKVQNAHLFKTRIALGLQIGSKAYILRNNIIKQWGLLSREVDISLPEYFASTVAHELIHCLDPYILHSTNSLDIMSASNAGRNTRESLVRPQNHYFEAVLKSMGLHVSNHQLDFSD